MRIKLTIEYDGTGFSGFQIQPGLRTVQSELENAIFKATGERSRIVGSGRTDTGVHAIAQVAHFDTNKDLGAKYAHALNYYLPNDVRVLAAERVSQEFHARFSAKSKTYVYVMYERATTSAIYLNRATQVSGKLNVAKMNEAAACFMGKHDFAAFKSAGSDTLTSIRTVLSATVRRRNGMIEFTVSADGFLYNMVRKMAAFLIEVGLGKMDKSDLDGLLDSSKAFTRVAPPEGLYLYKVEY